MLKLLIVGMGGFIGAVARYGATGFVHRHGGDFFPWGTLAINVTGCFLIGALVYFATDRAVLSPNVRLFLQIGILGAFTTFSTFGYETVELIRDRSFGPALANVGANVLLGVFAVWLGRYLFRALNV